MIYHTNRIACLINDKQIVSCHEKYHSFARHWWSWNTRGICILLGWSGHFGGIPLLNHNLGWPWRFGHYNLAKRITWFIYIYKWYIILENDEVYHELCTGKKTYTSLEHAQFFGTPWNCKDSQCWSVRFSPQVLGSFLRKLWSRFMATCCLMLFVANLKQIKAKGGPFFCKHIKKPKDEPFINIYVNNKYYNCMYNLNIDSSLTNKKTGSDLNPRVLEIKTYITSHFQLLNLSRHRGSGV